jgi:molybdenum cofactor cytidylyltransferase
MADGRRGNPVRWDRRMFPALLALRGDAGARSLLQGPGCDVLAIETGDRGVLEDFDDPARLAWFESGCEPGSEPRSGPRSGPSLIGRGD